ncbi:MAG: EF-P lysine aminoacylase GenX [Phenylobacterium sp.]|uniref:EF-P lysine aminoacylase EpmA n=1 Tax=Phenylobacterium sp. TaxID=1871053 RepID=UPI001A389CA9|nr:EF-P lysine aminoacylase EpmA [Phenylobacterium sp.]MBL8770380.1 EF-P lysine aminoacylase GenX [Phenylobacterium sp.]
MTQAPETPWWDPRKRPDRAPFLAARGRIIRAVRAWADREGLTEVEAAALQVSPGNEAHLHAFATEAVTTAGERRPLYLHTSPEFACKKLLASGETAIFTLGKVWRNRERGPLHHPEFTMLEWYRAHQPYEAIMADCAALLAAAAEAAEADVLRWRGREANPFLEPERLTVAEAFERHADIGLLSVLNDRPALAEDARRAGVRVAQDDTWADIFSRVIVEKIEPNLGHGRAAILYEYPASEAALARPKAGDRRVAERFELYACGVELANCFGELTDAVEQRRRFEVEMEEKAAIYGERYPIDEDFLAALARMPPASGGALGFDRLVMLATGASRIEQVLWTPVA